MILLTGATGFIGSHFLKSLLDRGEKVRALYRDPDKIGYSKDLLLRLGIQEELIGEQVDWFLGDILDLPRMEEAFDSIRGVVHCAALVSLNRGDRAKLRKINIEGTANIVHLGLRYGVDHLVHLSSVAALGHADPPATVNEETPWNPDRASCYGWSKREAELEVWKGIQEGLPSLIVNPGVVLGPGRWRSGSPSIYHKTRQGFHYYPPGQLGVISARTVAETALALLDGEYLNQNFVLVQEHWSYKELIQNVQQAVGVRKKTQPIAIRSLKTINLIQNIISLMGGKPVRISKEMIRSFTHPVRYDNRKAQDALNSDYADLRELLIAEAREYYGTSAT